MATNPPGPRITAPSPDTSTTLPEHIPSSWVAQIERAIHDERRKLIENASIPQPWLEQMSIAVKNSIDAATRPKIWVTLLGSSVLAAAVGILSSYVTVKTTGVENLKLELEKARIQQTTERTKAVQSAYGRLHSDVDRLVAQLEGTRILLGEMGRRLSPAENVRISTELMRIGQAASAVVDSNKNPLIEPSVSRSVDKALRALWPSLASAQADSKKARALVGVIATTRSELKSADTLIVRGRDSTESRNAF
jgi:hypothetical protein